MEETPKDYQTINCSNCGSIWRIERHTPGCDIVAELLYCPLCAELEAKGGE